MFIGILPTYVDRFARVWHRLSTTDLASDQATALIINDFVQKRQQGLYKKLFSFVKIAENYDLGC